MEPKDQVKVVFPTQIGCRVLDSGKYIGIQLSGAKTAFAAALAYEAPFHAIPPKDAEDLICLLIEALTEIDGKKRKLVAE